MRFELAMSQQSTHKPEESIVPRLKRAGKKHASIEEIVDSFRSAKEDIEQIGKLSLEEKDLAKDFLASLKSMRQVVPSIVVSTSVLPGRIRAAKEAYVDGSGFLTLSFEDGHQEIRDLNDARNIDLMVAVASDIAPKFESFVMEALDKIRNPVPVEQPVVEPPQIQEPPMPEPQVPAPPPVVEEPPPVAITDSTPEPEEEQPEEPQAPSPVLPMEGSPRLEEVTAETLGYLKELGGQVFEHSPVSRYFDDWMVNLRQVILSFESSGVIASDDIFTNERDKIFSNIEDELAQRLLKEAELEVSEKSLAENRHLLGEIDAGYNAESKELVVRGKSAIDFLINNVNHLQKEFAEIEKIKTSYLHPLKKKARDQRRTEVIEKLDAAKKRLALAARSAAVQTLQAGADTDFAAQNGDLAAKRKSALDFFTNEIDALKGEIAKLEKEKTHTYNPVKKVALEQKIWETAQKLNAAKKRLDLAGQSTGFSEQEMLRDEYDKKKQVAAGKVDSLEKEIASNEKDNSLGVRQAATDALADAVKSLVQRKTAPTQPDVAGNT